MKTNNSLLHNSLVHGSKLEGNVESDNDFRIDGIFKGKLTCSARVIIGPTGDFDGEINCDNAIVEGRFSGNLLIKQVLEVREGAVIEGDVNTNKLVVQSGSIFDVKCKMGDQPSTNKVSATSDPVLSELENGRVD